MHRERETAGGPADRPRDDTGDTGERSANGTPPRPPVRPGRNAGRAQLTHDSELR